MSCGCDPLMVLYLASQADQQDYYPEWLIAGVGFIDIDLGGQIIANNAPDQWARAFGGSPSAPRAARASQAYKAYQSVRDDEPSDLVDDRLLPAAPAGAIGIQMAGPNLTPETFETGHVRLPRRHRPGRPGTSSPEHYTPITDIREIWCDPDAGRPSTASPGSYLDNGQRYRRARSPRASRRCSREQRARAVAAARRARCWPAAAVPRPARCPSASCSGAPVRLGHRPAGRGPRAHLPHDPHHQLRLRRHGQRWRRAGRRPAEGKGWTWVLAALVGVAAGVVVGALVERLVIRRFANAPRLVLTVATIGLAQLLGGIAIFLPGWLGAPTSSPARPPR